MEDLFGPLRPRREREQVFFHTPVDNFGAELAAKRKKISA